jgi:UPF0755 protein
VRWRIRALAEIERMLRHGLGLMLILLSIGACAWLDATRQLHNALPIADPVRLEIMSGEGLSAVLNQLREQNIVTSARQMFYLRVYARLNNLGAALKAGEYSIKPGMSATDVIAMIISGRVMLHELRIIDGWTYAQLISAVSADPELQHTLAGQDSEAVMAAIGKPGIAAEGRFYPDTYFFPKGTSDAAFLRRAAAAMDKTLATEWQNRDQQIPFKVADDALILASIIEKETSAPDERAKIAGVFMRRLTLGMRLQTDPTVIYGLGNRYDGSLHRKDLETDTPFNTYTRYGLPPTPICMPGRASIHAAMHPEEGKALYFVSRGDGTHQFSETLKGQDAAVRRYQLNAPPDKSVSSNRNRVQRQTPRPHSHGKK